MKEITIDAVEQLSHQLTPKASLHQTMGKRPLL
jgi:hypothetical protein